MPSSNKKYIVVAIDQFMQWIEVGILTNQTSHSIMNFIELKILMRHECPSKIQTDGGRSYLSAGISNFFQNFIFVHEVAVPYHPRSGTAEQLVRSIKTDSSH